MKHISIKFKIVFFLSFLLAYTILGYSQKTKSYYIDLYSKETFKSDAIYKRKVRKVNEKWEVKDYYLNDSLAMTGTFLEKSLKTKIDTFKYYHINGKLSEIGFYKEGYKEGTFTKYNIAGNLVSSKNYFADAPTGEWIWCKFNGDTVKIVRNAAKQSIYSVENNAGYQGGGKAYNEHIQSYRYPPQASSDGYYGQTITTFKVSETGELSDIDVILHGTEEMDNFVTNVVQEMPNWIPAREFGEQVSSYNVLPLIFIIENNKVNIKNRTMAKAFHSSGVEDYKNNEFEKAAFKFKHAIKFDNTNAKYYYFYAVCLHQYQDPAVTIEYFKIANMLDDQIIKPEIKEYYKL